MKLLVDILMLITAHIFGDYVFQNDFLANNKGKYKFICLIHSWIWTVCIMLCLFLIGYNNVLGIPEFVVLLSTHYLLDRDKATMEDKTNTLTKDLWIDQAWHILTILVLVFAQYLCNMV